MTFLGLERPVEQGREQVFDPVTAQMVLNANRDYINAVYNEYQQAKQDMKDFNKEYGDFLSPITADMDWYAKNVTGAVRNKINDLYARGIDPLRSSEGRAAISMFLNSIDTAGIAKVRQSAEAAKEYLKNYGELNAAGLLNEDAEKYFGRDLSNWNTLGGSGIWRYTSPIHNKTMDDLIEPMIKNLDYTYDDERTKQANDGYDYYTVREDRIRQVINDSITDLTAKGTMGDYYYNKALQATGNDKEAALQLYKDWLVNRGKDHFKDKKEINQYKMLATKNAMERSNILLQDKLARDRDALNFQYKAALKGLGGARGTNGGSKYGSLTGAPYNLPEEVHHDGLYTAIMNQGIPVYKLVDNGRGELVPYKANGKMVQINPDDASWEELEYAANNNSSLITKQEQFAKKMAGNKPYSFVFDPKVQDAYLNQFGYHINSLEVGSLFPTKKVDKDGSIILSSQDIRNLRKMSAIIADSKGSRSNYSHGENGKDRRLLDVLPESTGGWLGSSNYVKDQLDSGSRVQANFSFDDTSDKNIMQLVGDDGESQIWVKGNVTYITGAPAGKQTPMSTVENVWLPTNIKSNKAVFQKFSTSTPWKSNFGLNSKYRSAYDAMAAHYAKTTGSQKNTNVALNGSEFEDEDDEWPFFIK